MRNETYMSMHLVFNHDDDLTLISKQLDIQPYDIKRLSQTRINPFTHQHNPGYIEIRTNISYSLSIHKVIKEIEEMICHKIDMIKDVINHYHAEVFFEIVCDIYNKDKPRIEFNKDFLDIVKELHGSIRIFYYSYLENKHAQFKPKIMGKIICENEENSVELYTHKYQDYESEKVTNEMIDITHHIDDYRVLNYIIYIYSDMTEYPAVYLEHQFLELVYQHHATIKIEIHK